jgi:hypothetical protein
VPRLRRGGGCGGATASLEALNRIATLLACAADDSLKRPEHFQPTGCPIEVPTYPGSPYRQLFPHPYLLGAEIEDPGDLLHEFVAGLTGQPRGPLGFDRYSITAALRKAAGLPDEWGWCKACAGSREFWPDPATKAASDAWERTEPPEGPGWQMWETTSEGSPISPVFPTPEELARWLADTGASAFGDETATYEEWLATIRRGWAVSAVCTPGRGLESGVAGQAAAEAEFCQHGE